MLSKGFLTIGLLIISNVFMTLAWYLHLKLQAAKVISFWPVWAVVLFSWSIALFEYSFQVPANRIGFDGNGGPFSLLELKVIQEVITLTVFTLWTQAAVEPSRRLFLFGDGGVVHLPKAVSLSVFVFL